MKNIHGSFGLVIYFHVPNIEKPFIILKNKTLAIIIGFVVTASVGFANIFTIIEPAIHGDLKSTIAMIAGPIVFIIAALIIYTIGEKK